MLSKICTVVFFIGMALWAFGVGFPYLLFLIGLSALVLGILAAL